MEDPNTEGERMEIRMDVNNLDTKNAAEPAPDPVGTLSQGEPTAQEPEAMTAEEWKAGGYYSVTITADPGDAAKAKQATAGSYEEYIELREGAHEQGLYIVSESFMTKEQYFPGLLTYSAAVEVFKTTDDRYIEFENFPQFSKRAKIRPHDSIVLAADTGGGKSSLAINFIDDLNEEYPVIYFNLEMDEITALRRLVSIHSGILLDRIEGYRKDEQTARAVNIALKEITARKPLQIVNYAYTLEDIEALIKHSIQFREDDAPTIVIIDHSLLVQTAGKAGNRYERFTAISEGLRRLSLQNNIILFVLLQQSREGKKDDTEPPKNWSLKESGSWENDATHICFLWWDPNTNQKKLLLTKNRTGEGGEFILSYEKTTQKYKEAQAQGAANTGTTPAVTSPRSGKKTPREKKRDKLQAAVELAYLKASENGAEVTLHDIAEAAGVTASTARNWIKEFGGYDINGKHYEPAGINDVIEGEGFTKTTQIEDQETPENFKTS